MFVTETNLKLLQLHRKHISRLQRVRRPDSSEEMHHRGNRENELRKKCRVL